VNSFGFRGYRNIGLRNDSDDVILFIRTRHSEGSCAAASASGSPQGDDLLQRCLALLRRQSGQAMVNSKALSARVRNHEVNRLSASGQPRRAKPLAHLFSLSASGPRAVKKEIPKKVTPGTPNCARSVPQMPLSASRVIARSDSEKDGRAALSLQCAKVPS
jgi:hypothetical protein